MSEKRFRLDYEEDDAIFIVEDDDIVYPIRNDTIKEYQLQKLVDKLNEQQATIKSKDKQLERLYNYFQDYLKDEMSGNAFSEMWDFVKEDEDWEDE